MSAPPGARPQHPVKGIALLLAAVTSFAIMEAIVKWLALRNPVPMIVFSRYFFNALLMLIIYWPSMGASLVQSRRPGMQWLRGAVLGISSILFFAGLAFLPLAEAASMTAIAPILVTVLAVRLLGERAPRGAAWALACSFTGVLLIVRPGGAVFSWAALLPLGSALCYTVYQLLTRKLSTIDSGTVTQFMGALVATLLLGLMVPFYWRMPDHALDMALMVAIGAIGGFGHLLLVRAFAVAPASLLAPFTYFHLVIALLLGFVVFGNMPDTIALTGMGLIVTTGVVMALRQRKPGQPAQAAQSARD